MAEKLSLCKHLFVANDLKNERGKRDINILFKLSLPHVLSPHMLISTKSHTKHKKSHVDLWKHSVFSTRFIEIHCKERIF